jgi:hypothetical protein
LIGRSDGTSTPRACSYVEELAAAGLRRHEYLGLKTGAWRLDFTPASELSPALTAALSAMDNLRTVPLEIVNTLRALDSLRPSLTRDDLNDRVSPDAVPQYRRDQMADDPLVLAPLCADPLGETLEHFLARAEEHYTARRVHLTRIAGAQGQQIAALHETSGLAEHIGWLIRYQIGDEGYRQIASAPRLVTADAVRVAVHRLANLLGLTLRPSQRDRQRTGSTGRDSRARAD